MLLKNRVRLVGWSAWPRSWLHLPGVLFQGPFMNAGESVMERSRFIPVPHTNKPKSSQIKSYGQSVSDVFSCPLSIIQMQGN